MAHFDPAVTLGYLIATHITRIQLTYYSTAEIICSLIPSIFIMYMIGNIANIFADALNYAFPISNFGSKVLTSAHS